MRTLVRALGLVIVLLGILVAWDVAAVTSSFISFHSSAVSGTGGTVLPMSVLGAAMLYYELSLWQHVSSLGSIYLALGTSIVIAVTLIALGVRMLRIAPARAMPSR